MKYDTKQGKSILVDLCSNIVYYSYRKDGNNK